MTSSDKTKIFYSVWCCAYQRRYLYRGTPRESREHDTILMCLNMKDVKFYQFDTEKPKHLEQP
jgi:hypothetical protein